MRRSGVAKVLVVECAGAALQEREGLFMARADTAGYLVLPQMLVTLQPARGLDPSVGPLWRSAERVGSSLAVTVRDSGLW